MSASKTVPSEDAAAALADRMEAARRRWRRGLGERLLDAAGPAAALLTLALFLLLSACAPTGEAGGDAPAAVAAGLSPEGDRCVPPPLAEDAPRAVLIAAGGAQSTKAAALREAIESYLGVRVEAVGPDGFDPVSLDGAKGLIIYGDDAIGDEAPIRGAIEAAYAREVFVTWIGPGAYAAAGMLDVTLDDSGVAFDPAPAGATLVYNDTEVPAAGLLMAEAVTGSPGEPTVTRARYRGPGGAERAAIAMRSDFLHIGFDPLDDFPNTHGFAIAMDALADTLKARRADPRVIFRLEDLNPYDYGDDDTTVAEVADYLIGRGVPISLAVIPEYVDADGQVLGDAGDMPSVREVLETYPGRTELVQHGHRHHRDDPRNAGMGSGDAYEFYFDDDETMGPAAAAAFARERLEAGRAILETHLRPVYAFEAPHYAMSPSEEAVAEEMYDLIHHPPLNLGGEANSVATPWFTIRGDTAYAPSSAGYVEIDEDGSVDEMLDRLAVIAALNPDPVAVVFFHPFIWEAPGRRGDLARLVDGIEALGFRFVSACEALAEAR